MNAITKKQIACFVEWIFYNVLFSLMPLISSLILKKSFGKSIQAEDCLPEILFFTTALSISSLSNITRSVVTEKLVFARRILTPILLLLATMTAVLYGAHLFHSQIKSDTNGNFSASLATIATYFAIVCLCCCGIAEYLLARETIVPALVQE